MIRLLQLRLKNFLSHVDTTLFLSEYEGLVLIEGKTSDGHYSSNGAGKSTLLEGIIYALTGDTLRGVSVNDVINRNYKKNTEVTLTFTKGDLFYRVSRYRKHDEYGDSLVLYKGEENISKRVNKETQKTLEDILGISYKILVSTMLLGEGLSSRFTQLSDPEKKSLIESTLNLNYDISAIRAKANNSLSQLKLDLSNISGKLSVIQKLCSLDLESSEKLAKECEEKEAEACKELSSQQASLADLQASRTPLEDKIQLLKTSLMEYENAIRERDRIMLEISAYDDEIHRIQHAECPACSVCHQSLSSEESKRSSISSYEERKSAANQNLLQIEERISNIPPRNIIESKYNELSSMLKNISQQIVECSTAISKLISDSSRYKYEAQQIRDDIDRYEESVSTISSLEEESKEITSDMQRYDYFYKLFSPTGILVDILSDAVSYINTRLSTYSEVLLEKDYNINFTKGKISLIDSKGSSYQSLSNGEKRRLDISIQFALHDYVHTYCGMKMDTLFIDEILDTLDDIGVENIFEVLRLKIDYCQLKSIYVITHNNTLKEKFDRVITISKDREGNSLLQ